MSFIARQALAHHGLRLVSVFEPGGPSPGRIADRLVDILEDAARRREGPRPLDTVPNLIAEIESLAVALDYWDMEMMKRAMAEFEDRKEGGAE